MDYIPGRQTGGFSMSHHEIAEKPKLTDALAGMAEALRMLDEAGAPGEIGSHLDLAIARLEERLGLNTREPALPEEFISLLEAGAENAIAGPKSAWDVSSA
jgi:hypothetical protein